MTLDEKKEALKRRLEPIPNRQERLNALVLDYRVKDSLSADYKTDAYRIEGCLSKLWFTAEAQGGRCYFKSDSDSLVVKAVAGLLCDLYSGLPPEEIASSDPAFLKDLGISEHLTTNRRNGLSKLWDKIRGFALSNIPGQVNLAEMTH